MKSQSVLISCNKHAFSSLTRKSQKLSKTPLVWAPLKRLSFSNFGARLKVLDLGGPSHQEKPKMLPKGYNYFATKFLFRGLFFKSYSSCLGNKSTQMLGIPKILAKNLTPSWSYWYEGLGAEEFSFTWNKKQFATLSHNVGFNSFLIMSQFMGLARHGKLKTYQLVNDAPTTPLGYFYKPSHFLVPSSTLRFQRDKITSNFMNKTVASTWPLDSGATEFYTQNPAPEEQPGGQWPFLVKKASCISAFGSTSPCLDTHKQQVGAIMADSQSRRLGDFAVTKTHELGGFVTKDLFPNNKTTEGKSRFLIPSTSPKFEVFGLTSKLCERLLSNNSLWAQKDQQPKKLNTSLVPLRSLNTKVYSRSLSFRHRLSPCFAFSPTRDFSNLVSSHNSLWSSCAVWQQGRHQTRKTQHPQNVVTSLNSYRHLSNYKELQIIKTILIPPILTNTFIFGLYKLQKQTYKYKEPIRNICKYLVVYVIGSVCWLYYANISTKIEKTGSKQGWNLAQEMILKNLPLLKNSGVFLTKETTEISTFWWRQNPLVEGFGQRPQPCKKYQEGLWAHKLNILANIPSGPKGFGHKTLDKGLQNNYTFFRETSNPSSFLVNSSSVNQVLGLWSSSDSFGQRLHLGSRPLHHFSQDKITQNYIANIPVKRGLRLDMKSNLNVQKTVSKKGPSALLRMRAQQGKHASKESKNLFFFARKPLFFKQNSFLNTQMLSQKEQYLCSGTAMIIGSEFDFLPRKIEFTGFFNKNKSTIHSAENRHVKFSVEVKKMEKPKIYKLLSDVTLNSIQNAELGQNFGFGLAASWWRCCAYGACRASQAQQAKSRLEVSLPNILKEPETCAFKVKTAEQKGYLRFLKSSFLSVRSESHSTTTKNTVSRDPRDSWGASQERFGALSFEPNRPSGDIGANSPSRSLNQTDLEKKNFSRALIIARVGEKEGAMHSKGAKKTPNRTTIIKNKKLLKDKNLLERFCRSRLQSGFNFPDLFFFNKSLIETEKSGTALKIKKNYGVNPENSGLPTFVSPYIKTDPTTFSIKEEFSGSNENTKIKFNNVKADPSKSAVLLGVGHAMHGRDATWSCCACCACCASHAQHAQHAQHACSAKHGHLGPLDSGLRSTTKTTTWPKRSIKPPSLAKNFKNLTNSPESFFGTSYLRLGERFTISQIKSKNQIGFLSNVNNGDMFASSRLSTLPFVSTGTSLNTVFGKKALKQQSSKRAFKTQSPFTNARAVSEWHIIDCPKYKGYWSWKNDVQQNSETRYLNQSHIDFKNDSVKNQKIANNGFVETQQTNPNNLGYLLYPKRISGKVNRYLINPFKYYNPGTKRDRNIEDAMLTLEGYKKSRLFPTTHIHFHGISEQFLDVSVSKKNQGQYLNTQTNQDIDLQSILSGMRQKNEAQRIAEKTIGPLYENSELQKENNLRLQEELREADNLGLTWENKEENRGTDSFFSESDVTLKHHANRIQKKNLRNTNNYPLRTLLAAASWRQGLWPCNTCEAQPARAMLDALALLAPHSKHSKGNATHPKHCPKILKTTALTEYNFTNLGRNHYSLNPNTSQVKFLEKNLVENSQLGTTSLDSLGANARSWQGQKAQSQIGHTTFLQGSNQTKGFYFEKIFATPILRSQPQTFKVIGGMESALISPLISKTGIPIEQVRHTEVAIDKANFYSFIQNLKHKNTSISSLKSVFARVQVWGSLSKILFFSVIWSSYKLLATPLTISNFLPATFTEAIGLQSFQKKYRIITRGNTKVDFKNLAGIEKTLSELRDLIWTFRLVGTGGPYGEYSNLTRLPYLGNSFGQQRSSVFSKTRNRILLVGPPGTGKTLLVKALAAEANVPVIVQPVSQLRMISGVENPVSALFHVARQIKPCIIFLDELDTLGTDINNSDKSSHISQKIDTKLAQKYTYTLLLELDGLVSSTRDLLIIGATNRPETLNPALTRAGRFETIINCNLPSQEQRFALFSLYLPRAVLPGVGHAVHGAEARSEWSFGPRPLRTNTQKDHSGSLVATKQGQDAQQGPSVKPMALIGAGDNRVLLGGNKGTKQESKGQNRKSSFSLVLQPSHETQLQYKDEKVIKNVSYLNYVTKLSYGLSQASIETAINQSALNSILQGNHCHTFTTLEQALNDVKVLTSKTTTETAFDSSWSFSRLGHAYYRKNRHQKGAGVLVNMLQSKKNTKLTSTEFDPTTDFKVELFDKKEKKVSQKNLQFLVCTAYQNTGPFLLYQSTISYSQKDSKADLTGLLKRKRFTVYKTKGDSALPSLEFALFQNYAGQACCFLYNGLRSQSLHFSHTFGLYKNPVQLGATLFLLKNSEERSTKSGILSTSWSQQDAEVSIGNNSELSINNKQKHYYWCQNIKKENKSINTQQISSVQKTSSFFVNELSRQIRLSNPLKTGWFRMYLSRPIFRYDSSEYIENKEYYPKNNYGFYSDKRLQPLKGFVPSRSRGQRVTHFINVATLSHQTTFNAPLSLTGGLPKAHRNKKAGPQVHETFGKIYRENNFVPQKFSLYLAIVAFIFHNTLLFMQDNRELADYCVYKKLRYGGLYEFYIDQVCQKFRKKS